MSARSFSRFDFRGKFKRAENGCWNWMSAKNSDGYGRFYWQEVGKQCRLTAHRAMWFSLYGSIPKDMCVLHKCDNPGCVRPSHLYVGTQLQNIADRVSRGRGGGWKIRGELHVNAKISESHVRLIRESPLSQSELTSIIGIGKSQINRIKRKESWKHV